MPATTESVAAALGIAAASQNDADWLAAATDAANAYVESLPHYATLDAARADMGAVMLAVRLYHGRSAPLGAAGMDIAGGLVRASTDPELARMLRIGRYAMPAAG